MSVLVTVARPYAEAAFHFAIENQDVARWQSMLAFSAEVTQNKQMNELLYGSVAPKKLANTFISICGNQLDVFGQNLIRVMAENGRLALLPHVLKQFILFHAAQKKAIEVNVISASQLKEKQREKITAAMERRLLLKVNLNCKVDTSIMAGIVIRAGNMVIDGSVRGRLKRLADVLQS
ncbi:MAG: ATP synthase F1 complex subunit delta [Sodalis sp. Psp]|nr:ATP synthase F1 complex subunit delta [Sodalis sp. Psp]MCR3757315.1 ATP synthase F1 complex subunit delta [Sodalis sp. Ppy]